MSKSYSLIFGIICCALWGTPRSHLKEAFKDPAIKRVKKSARINRISDKSTVSILFPLEEKSLSDVVSGYGENRSQGKRKHEGIDIPSSKGTAVIAVSDGVIIKVADKGNAGKQVWLKGGTFTYFYAHLDGWHVKKGQKVKKGDKIATVGNSGNASKTLPHLHFGIYSGKRQTIDPASFY
jgi:murein DD-endopeptidase MepM/ murein hydrolase activator NlpD